VTTSRASGSTGGLVCISRHQQLFGSWAAYLLIDSFYISVLTACLLRLLLV
jgi:hypothetical protein